MSTQSVGAAWLGDWRGRIRDGLRKCGYSSLTELLRAREESSFSQLIWELGGELAIIQIQEVLRDETRTQPEFDYYSRTMFVRYIREECPGGWKRHGEDLLRGALTGWGSSLGEYAGVPHPWLTVVRRLQARQDLSDDWLPSGVDDPVIKDIFAGVEFRMKAPSAV